jgi:hypothetical protein
VKSGFDQVRIGASRAGELAAIPVFKHHGFSVGIAVVTVIAGCNGMLPLNATLWFFLTFGDD